MLPALTIIVTSMAGWMLQMRNVMITTIGEDYVLVAQAKGLSPRRVMFTYAARNAILPNLAGFALSLGFVVAGALVMEIVFSYPGIGLTALQRGHVRRLPAAPGDLPGHLVLGAVRLPPRRHRLLLRRPAHADRERVLMSAIAAGIDPLPGGTEQPPPAIIAHRPGWLRRVPGKAKVGAAVLGLFVPIAVIGPTIAPFDPTASTPGQALPLAPNATHLLGTTSTGQDVLSQLLVGTRSTVVLGLLTGLIATLLAVVIGMSAGFLGGLSDEGLSLVANVFLVLPALPLLVVILGYLPHSGELPTAIVLSALGWPWGARVIRAQTLSLRNRDYVAAARESGERSWRIIIFEILPNEIGLIAASFVGTVLYAILTSVALAFLGVADLSQLELRDDARTGPRTATPSSWAPGGGTRRRGSAWRCSE